MHVKKSDKVDLKAATSQALLKQRTNSIRGGLAMSYHGKLVGQKKRSTSLPFASMNLFRQLIQYLFY